MSETQRIAVWTLTRDRLEYTKRAFASLENLAGIPYDHYVIDNGSADGTREWLRERDREFKFLNLRPCNIGIGLAGNVALDAIQSHGGADYVIKFDNDALVLSDNILSQMVECFEGAGTYGPQWILSPRVEGINRQPKRGRAVMLAGRRVGVTGHVGGLFLMAPWSVWDGYRFPTDLPKAQGYDSHLCGEVKRKGGEVGYVEGLVVEHLDGSDAQAVKFPGYHARKMRELGTPSEHWESKAKEDEK